MARQRRPGDTIRTTHFPTIVDHGDGATLGPKVACGCGWVFTLPATASSADALDFMRHHQKNADHPEWGPRMAGDPRAAAFAAAQAAEKSSHVIGQSPMMFMRQQRPPRRYPGMPAEGPLPWHKTKGEEP